MIELGKGLSQEAFKKVSEGLDRGSASGSSAGGAGKKDFSSMLESIDKGDVSSVIRSMSNERDLTSKKDLVAIQSESIETMPVKDEQARPTQAMQKVSDILGEVNEGQNKLQKLVDLVTSGQKFSAQELVALQAGVYSLVQEMELVSKATQEAAQGVRQTLNTNVG